MPVVRHASSARLKMPRGARYDSSVGIQVGPTKSGGNFVLNVSKHLHNASKPTRLGVNNSGNCGNGARNCLS